MPQTLTGWILFAAILASVMRAAATATKLVMALRGKAAHDRLDIHAAYAFGTLLLLFEEGR
ncbi:hypothetical protein MKK65_08225 [Methylobacterium sp. J-001]|uniref:hypothetical protein n=1 Tax=Methylobacterium sp. J-001 TaxID=2836609 RepID=UPI001FB8FDAD|nr:hypothetical protein [Methylobacterium sp. J-001]MCJ2116565.1 hypothetical protein [Methylobacterium sp. J-001]